MNDRKRSFIQMMTRIVTTTVVLASGLNLFAQPPLMHWRFAAPAGMREMDASGQGHPAELVRGEYNRPHPERLPDGTSGAIGGSIRLTRDAVVRSLAPVALPERWTLTFWMMDERPRDERPAWIDLAELLSVETHLLGLDEAWHFLADPEDIGIASGWHEDANGDAWTPIDVAAFWGETHVGRDYHGYGWYATRFYVPREYAGLTHELHFEGIDEQGWVYVNGQWVGEQSTASTGLSNNDLWDVPFSVMLEPEHLRAGERNLLTVRTHAAAYGAGIFRPAYVLPPDTLRQRLNLDGLRLPRRDDTAWVHVALAVEPGRAVLYVDGVPRQTMTALNWPFEANRVQVAFRQQGAGRFAGRLDQVRLFAGILPEPRITELARDIHHPDALEWLAAYDEAMQALIRAGRLSPSFSAYLIDLGAPDVGALNLTLEASRDVREKTDVMWCLRYLGDVEALHSLIARLDDPEPEIVLAAGHALKHRYDDATFPRLLQERADAASVAALDRVIRLATDDGVRKASIRGLAALDDPLAVAALSRLVMDETLDFDLRVAALASHPDAVMMAPNLLNRLRDETAADQARLDALTLIDSQAEILQDRLAADAEARQALARMVTDPARDQRLRLAAMDAHAVIQGEATVLIEVLNDSDGDAAIRHKALTLIKTGDAAWVKAMAEDAATLDTLTQLSLPTTVYQSLRAAAVAALRRTGAPLPDAAADWPMWRYDAGRSAATPYPLSENLRLQWVRTLPPPERAWPFQHDDLGKLDFDRSYAPVVMGDRIFVPSSVTDSLTAYRVEDGRELWRFYAEGPIRLAPAAWRDRVFFVSDDGYLYCLNAHDGALIWKFKGGPTDQRLLGNERIINLWSARGAPVVADGQVYFAAGIWPRHGVFIYALDADTGTVRWVNDTTSSDYVDLPHGGASGYGGLAPQGYLAVDGDRLVVAGGRTPPVVLDRRNGQVVRARFRTRKGDGHYAVHADGMGYRQNAMLTNRLATVSDQVDGEVFYKLAARDRLFVTTVDGLLYCFGPDSVEPRYHRFQPTALTPRTDAWASVATDVLDRLDETEGYALILGAGSGDLLRELLKRSALRTVVVEADPDQVAALRDELADAGVYGRRAAVIMADPAHVAVQPYLFSVIVSERAPAGLLDDAAALAHILDRLRPYGGLAWLGAFGVDRARLQAVADRVDVDRVTLSVSDGDADHLFARRDGPLSGAGQWTHQYHDAANTLASSDSRVRQPLGILWFGGPTHDNVLPRHAGGPRPHIVGGRQIYLGVETIAARCVYTGRQIWERAFPGIGHPFTNIDLEAEWSEGQSIYMSNVPGATYIGSPFVSQPDGIYLRYGERIYRLNPATGQTIDDFVLPGKTVAERYGDPAAPDWGTLRVTGDYLITTAEPHIFEDQGLGLVGSYSGTSSRRLVVMNRVSGEVLWQREALVGFRHNAIVAAGDTLFIIDGLSENAVAHLARRGRLPDTPSRIMALNADDGRERWSVDSDVFGTYLMYSPAHDILIEGGSQDMRRTAEDEPRNIIARCGALGEILWDGGRFTLPGAIVGDRLIPGRPGIALNIRTGQPWQYQVLAADASHYTPHAPDDTAWSFRRAYGCNTLNASEHLLLFRSGYAGYYDLEHDIGTGTFSGFRSGCTANMIAADGVLNALDYTRTCTCSYAHQTSLAMIWMPDDSNIEEWTRYDAAPPDLRGYGINFGAPGRRMDRLEGRVWHDEPGALRRHPSAIRCAGPSINWVVASGREIDESGRLTIALPHAATYTVRLHFAELDPDVREGHRMFDVRIGGNRILQDFDIVAETGGALQATVKTFTASADDGELVLEFAPSGTSTHSPLINGIELIAHDLQTAAGSGDGRRSAAIHPVSELFQERY